ncbi:MAG: type II toxin-antitoxin system RelE/ParE family toxin, partial [Microvirga sp.]
MARRLFIARAAARDLHAVRQWLRQGGAGLRAAARLRHIHAAIRELRRSPTRWPVCDHPGLREFSVEGHRVIYAVKPDTGENATTGD